MIASCIIGGMPNIETNEKEKEKNFKQKMSACDLITRDGIRLITGQHLKGRKIILWLNDV